jgi:hypothetical protein
MRAKVGWHRHGNLRFGGRNHDCLVWSSTNGQRARAVITYYQAVSEKKTIQVPRTLAGDPLSAFDADLTPCVFGLLRLLLHGFEERIK